MNADGGLKVRVTSSNASRVLRSLFNGTDFEGSEIQFMGRNNHDFHFLVEVLMEEDEFLVDEYSDSALEHYVQRVLNLCNSVQNIALIFKDINNFPNNEGDEVAFAGIILRVLL